ncbi:MAG: alcohol dehydrogenase catalytic domain-containing protein [Planctomycetes bacterium]|nr:alcohol dehydrogenase catalytic domain-containing protein [Planctomycetota bacterium]
MKTTSLALSFRPLRVLAVRALGKVWRGATFSAFSPLVVREIDVSLPPKPGWVRVKNRLAGICGSDLSLVFSQFDFDIAPLALPSSDLFYLGHEVVGEVAETGNGVEGLSPGDRVFFRGWEENCAFQGLEPPCPECAAGNYCLCRNLAEGAGAREGQVGGGWGGWMLVRASQIVPLPRELSDEEGVLVEPFACSFRAVLRRPPPPGGRVLVIGAGTIGLGAVFALSRLFPEARVAVLARHPHQRELARALGAQTVHGGGDLYEEFARLTGARSCRGPGGNSLLLGGFDVVYDCVSSERTLADSLRWTRARGAVVVAGANLRPRRFDHSPVWFREVDLVGAIGHGREIHRGVETGTLDLTIRTLLESRGLVSRLVTHRFPLADYRRAILTAADKRVSGAVKVTFDLSGS